MPTHVRVDRAQPHIRQALIFLSRRVRHPDRDDTALDIHIVFAGHNTIVALVPVEKGTGAFTLYLPTLCRGWPHVSFYPAEGGSDFGGNYFGTGDFVLKRWWGFKETDRKTARAAARSKDGTPAAPAVTSGIPTASEFPLAVRFDQGAIKFKNGNAHLSVFHEWHIPAKLFAERVGQQRGLGE